MLQFEYSQRKENMYFEIHGTFHFCRNLWYFALDKVENTMHPCYILLNPTFLCQIEKWNLLAFKLCLCPLSQINSESWFSPLHDGNNSKLALCINQWFMQHRCLKNDTFHPSICPFIHPFIHLINIYWSVCTDSVPCGWESPSIKTVWVPLVALLKGLG